MPHVLVNRHYLKKFLYCFGDTYPSVETVNVSLLKKLVRAQTSPPARFEIVHFDHFVSGTPDINFHHSCSIASHIAII
jgi:hypothetical protein